jgi:hypothetical protein
MTVRQRHRPSSHALGGVESLRVIIVKAVGGPVVRDHGKIFRSAI